MTSMILEKAPEFSRRNGEPIEKEPELTPNASVSFLAQIAMGTPAIFATIVPKPLDTTYISDRAVSRNIEGFYINITGHIDQSAPMNSNSRRNCVGKRHLPGLVG